MPGLLAGVGQVNLVIPQAANSSNVSIAIFAGNTATSVSPAKVTVAVKWRGIRPPINTDKERHSAGAIYSEEICAFGGFSLSPSRLL
jgi:hypothetical protein